MQTIEELLALVFADEKTLHGSFVICEAGRDPGTHSSAAQQKRQIVDDGCFALVFSCRCVREL